MIQRRVTLLDLGGVVFQSTGISNEIINWEVITQLNSKYGFDLNIGKDVFPNFMADYNEITNQSISGPDFLEKLFDTLEMNTSLIEIVLEYSDIIIVSDNYRENISYISERYDFERWATKQIYSFDYGMIKSNPEFFQRLKVDVNLDQFDDVLFIDDSIEKIDSATKSGIKGLLYESNEKIDRELKELWK